VSGLVQPRFQHGWATFSTFSTIFADFHESLRKACLRSSVMAGTLIDIVMRDLKFLSENKSEGAMPEAVESSVPKAQSRWRRLLTYLPFSKNS